MTPEIAITLAVIVLTLIAFIREWAAPDDPEGSAEAAADWSRSAAGMGAWEEASRAAQIALRFLR